MNVAAALRRRVGTGESGASDVDAPRKQFLHGEVSQNRSRIYCESRLNRVGGESPDSERCPCH
jgi:hypothetical protein